MAALPWSIGRVGIGGRDALLLLHGLSYGVLESELVDPRLYDYLSDLLRSYRLVGPSLVLSLTKGPVNTGTTCREFCGIMYIGGQVNGDGNSQDTEPLL